MLADAVTGDKRLEKFRHTRPELEPGVSTHPADSSLAMERVSRTFRTPLRPWLAEPAQGPTTGQPMGTQPANPRGSGRREPHRWHGAGGSLHPR